MKNQTDIEKRTITITRTFQAPRSLVWQAWSQPEHLAQWWGRGMKMDIKKHDFRVGGEWEYSMVMPNGGEFRSFGVYSEIIELERIVSSANFVPMTEGVTIFAIFEENGNATDLIFKVIHPTEEYCKQQEEMGIYNGWGSVFEALTTYLGALSS